MVSEGGSALARAGGVLALDLDGVLFLSPEPTGVVGEYVDRRRVRVKVPRLRDVWEMRVSEPVWVSPSMIADVNAVIGLPGVRLVLVSSWGAAAVEAARQVAHGGRCQPGREAVGSARLFAWLR